jgi:hypothetical protein
VSGAQLCALAGDIVGGTFLLLTSQIRFHIDSELLFPADDEAGKQRAMRSQYLFYRAGGSGPDALYRDREKTEKLYSLLEGWTAAMPAQYDPGWKYKRLPSIADVVETSQRHKYSRIQKLKWYAALIANDEYYAAKKDLSKLSRKQKNTFIANSPEAKQQAEFMKKMRRIESQLNFSKPDERMPQKFT